MLIIHQISIQRKEHPPGWFDFNDSFHIQLFNNRKRKTSGKELKVSSSLAAIKAIIILQKCLLKLPFSVGLTNLSDMMTGKKNVRATKIEVFSLLPLPKESLPPPSPAFPEQHFLCLFIINPFLLLLGQTCSPMGLHVALKTNNREPLASFRTIYHCC